MNEHLPTTQTHEHNREDHEQELLVEALSTTAQRIFNQYGSGRPPKELPDGGTQETVLGDSSGDFGMLKRTISLDGTVRYDQTDIFGKEDSMHRTWIEGGQELDVTVTGENSYREQTQGTADEMQELQRYMETSFPSKENEKQMRRKRKLLRGLGRSAASFVKNFRSK